MDYPRTAADGEVVNEYELSEGAKAVTIPLKMSWKHALDREIADTSESLRQEFERSVGDTLMQNLYGPEIHRQGSFLTDMKPLGPRTLGFRLWLRIRAQQRVRQGRLRLGEFIAGEKFGER